MKMNLLINVLGLECKGRRTNMYLYELILDILGKKGTVPIPTLCQEITQLPLYRQNRQKSEIAVKPSTIKSIIERKNDLFILKDDHVAIHPDKQLNSLIANVGGSFGPWYKVEVDFINKVFLFFEWHMGRNQQSSIPRERYHGNVDIFKRDIYRINVWDWKQDYQLDGIVLDGTSWSVTLTTTAKIYESRGLQSFPPNWDRFCIAVQSLTGKPFQ